MANFRPINNFTLYILDKIISQYHLQPPFLDIACGSGYLSRHLGINGWKGKAIDYSENAVAITKNNLKEFKYITVEKKPAYSENGKYKTVLMFDLLEHIKEDLKLLKKVYSLLKRDGFVVICVPSNPKEWRWDDDFYGHYRRYTENELKDKLIKEGFKPLVFYDYTFPFFWILRRIYTSMKKETNISDKQKQTKKSSFIYAWNMPLISNILNNTSILWIPIYIIQYAFFRKNTSRGNAMFVLAKKVS